jgi:ubiquinone/menaquinone biosynthesis C-methylase UbiE
MNSITLVENLLDEKTDIELERYLSGLWNQVWSDGNPINYTNLRLFKTMDKVKNISSMGIEFKNKNVLDIGCGNGITLLYLRKFFNVRATGVDISDHVISGLQENIKDKNLVFLLGDHRGLKGIGNDQFDIVLSFGVIEHFDEYSLTLSEARRVLRPGGHLILIQPHLLSFGVLQEYCLRVFGKWKFGKQKDFSCFYYRVLLRQLGFRNIKFATKPPYKDMNATRIFDSILKNFMNERTIELELRSEVMEQDRENLGKHLNEIGILRSRTRRLSVMLFGEVAEKKIDIRIRITNGECEVVVKSGSFGSHDRIEISQKIYPDQFLGMVSLLSQLGFLMEVGERETFNYELPNGVIISMVFAGEIAYVELEKMSSKLDLDENNVQLMSVARQLKLRILDEKGFEDLCKRLTKTVDWSFCNTADDYKKLEQMFENYTNEKARSIVT